VHERSTQACGARDLGDVLVRDLHPLGLGSASCLPNPKTTVKRRRVYSYFESWTDCVLVFIGDDPARFANPLIFALRIDRAEQAQEASYRSRVSSQAVCNPCCTYFGDRMLYDPPGVRFSRRFSVAMDISL
jgi:hypothetical protein